MNLLSLLFPVTLVSADVLKVLVHVDIVAADNLLGSLNNVLWQTYLVGNLDGKRAARVTNLKLEERAESVAVIEHSSVDNARSLFGKMLQVGEVGGDDTIDLCLIELAEQSLCYGSSNLWLCATSKLVNEY